jgi:hypothetical protein
MISYQVYKIVHFVGIFMVFVSLGASAMHSINGGRRDHSWRRPTAFTHGIGLFLVLVGGFGLLARLGISQGGLPGWIYAKLVIWFLLGAMLSVTIRIKSLARVSWPILILLGGTAAYLAGYKPF